jgi:hypothetical protein
MRRRRSGQEQLEVEWTSATRWVDVPVDVRDLVRDCRARAKSWNTCCQTHSSLRLRKNRSIMPFCSGVVRRDELLRQPVVATRTKAPTLKHQPVVAPDHRGRAGGPQGSRTAPSTPRLPRPRRARRTRTR